MTISTLVLTDSLEALGVARELSAHHGGISIFQSFMGEIDGVPRLNVATEIPAIASRYDLVISIHCKQLFPPALVERVRCVNVHPGFNPFNRGWFSQVFSIINGLKCGVTIHEIDAKIDHGRIIVRREYRITPWDTSETAYANIMTLEKELLFQHYPSIRDGSYRAFLPEGEGNLNYKSDFEKLRQLDLNSYGRFGDFLNHLRAMTHGGFKNAYFVAEDGRRVFVRVKLEPENVDATDLRPR